MAELPDDMVEAVAAIRYETATKLPWAALVEATRSAWLAQARRELQDVYPLIADRVRAEAVADERQRLADVILPGHWQTVELWGGVQRLACGRCRHGDGVRFLWPCPTRRALTGEAEPEPNSALVAAGSVPVATPPTQTAERIMQEPPAGPALCEHGCPIAHVDSDFVTGVEVRCPGPVATPTKPAACTCDGAYYYSPAQNVTRRPFVINKRCPIHGEASPVPAEQPEPNGQPRSAAIPMPRGVRVMATSSPSGSVPTGQEASE